MAWDNAVVTNRGTALLQRVLAGETLTLVSASGGTGNVPPAVLMAQTALADQRQVLAIAGVVNVSGGKKVNIQIVNRGLAAGYPMQQLGIWARIGGEPAVLFAILQDRNGIMIPSEPEIPEFALNFYAVIDFKNEAEFQLVLDPAALVTAQTMSDAITAAVAAVPRFIDVVCETAASAAAKVINAPEHSLRAGDLLSVKYTLGSTASAPTINFNGEGARNIRVGAGNPTGAAATGQANVIANGTVMYRFDGVFFHQFGGTLVTDQNTTDITSLNGTLASTLRIHNPTNSTVAQQQRTFVGVTDTGTIDKITATSSAAAAGARTFTPRRIALRENIFFLNNTTTAWTAGAALASAMSSRLSLTQANLANAVGQYFNLAGTQVNFAANAELTQVPLYIGGGKDGEFFSPNEFSVTLRDTAKVYKRIGYFSTNGAFYLSDYQEVFVHNGSRWVPWAADVPGGGGGRHASLMLAAQNSSAEERAQADYVWPATFTHAHLPDWHSLINTAFAEGQRSGTIHFAWGTYNTTPGLMLSLPHGIIVEGNGSSIPGGGFMTRTGCTFRNMNSIQHIDGENSLTITNCTIDGNNSPTSGIWTPSGTISNCLIWRCQNGGISAMGAGDLKILNCRFFSNTTADIWMPGDEEVRNLTISGCRTSSPVFLLNSESNSMSWSNILIENNTQDGWGTSDSVVLHGCFWNVRIQNNTFLRRIKLYHGNWSTQHSEDVQLIGNTCGSIVLALGSPATTPHTFRHCVIQRNYIYNPTQQQSQLDVHRSIITHNITTQNTAFSIWGTNNIVGSNQENFN
jgi:hypothetical protein